MTHHATDIHRDAVALNALSVHSQLDVTAAHLLELHEHLYRDNVPARVANIYLVLVISQRGKLPLQRVSPFSFFSAGFTVLAATHTNSSLSFTAITLLAANLQVANPGFEDVSSIQGHELEPKDIFGDQADPLTRILADSSSCSTSLSRNVSRRRIFRGQPPVWFGPPPRFAFFIFFIV